MVGIVMVWAKRWVVLIGFGVFVGFAGSAAADDQDEIQQAFSQVKGWPKRSDAQNAGMEPALGFNAYFSKVAKQAYGTDPFDVRSESLPALYAVYAYRSMVACYLFASGKALAEKRTQQGGVEELVALGQGQGSGFFPWKGGQEEISEIKIDGDHATAKYSWRGSSMQNDPLAFDDVLAFQRTDGAWRLEFLSYVAVMERNAAPLGASMSAIPLMQNKMTGPLNPGFERNETALSGAKMRVVPVLIQGCPPMRAEYQKASNREELFKVIWAATSSLMVKPIKDWPERS